VGLPFIDAGTPYTTGLYLPEFDLLGILMVFNNRIDMGTYEWCGVANRDGNVPTIPFIHSKDIVDNIKQH